MFWGHPRGHPQRRFTATWSLCTGRVRGRELSILWAYDQRKLSFLKSCVLTIWNLRSFTWITTTAMTRQLSFSSFMIGINLPKSRKWPVNGLDCNYITASLLLRKQDRNFRPINIFQKYDTVVQCSFCLFSLYKMYWIDQCALARLAMLAVKNAIFEKFSHETYKEEEVKMASI